jgi:hypothetical protein
MQFSKNGNSCRPPLDAHSRDCLGHIVGLIMEMCAKVFRN